MPVALYSWILPYTESGSVTERIFRVRDKSRARENRERGKEERLFKQMRAVPRSKNERGPLCRSCDCKSGRVTRRLPELPVSLPVVLITGSGKESRVSEAVEEGRGGERTILRGDNFVVVTRTRARFYGERSKFESPLYFYTARQ